MKMVILIVSFLVLSLSANELSDGEKEYKAGNFKKAQELFTSACDKKETDACDRLERLYRDRRFVRQHQAEAVAWLESSCNRNDMLSCSQLGYMYYYGEGVQKNNREALSLFRRACDSGVGRACNNLAIMYEDGEGVRQDTTEAKELYGKGCDNGNDASCKAYKRLGSTPRKITVTKTDYSEEKRDVNRLGSFYTIGAIYKFFLASKFKKLGIGNALFVDLSATQRIGGNSFLGIKISVTDYGFNKYDKPSDGSQVNNYSLSSSSILLKYKYIFEYDYFFFSLGGGIGPGHVKIIDYDKLRRDPVHGFLTEKSKNDLLINKWLFISEVAVSTGVKLFGGLFLETEAGFQFTTKLQGYETYMHHTFIGVNIGGYISS